MPLYPPPNSTPSPPTGAQSVPFVFRPGGTPADNVYDDFATLMAACDLVEGPREIAFDDSVTTPCVVPAGTWNMREVSWVSGGPGYASLTPNLSGKIPFVHVVEGAVFTRLRRIVGVQVTWRGSTPPVTDWQAGPPDVFVLDDGTSLNTDGTATGPFLRFANAGSAPVISIRNGSSIVAVTQELADIAVAMVVYAECGLGSFLAQDTVSGVAGSTLILSQNASTAFAAETQSNMAGQVESGSSAFGTPLVRWYPRPSLFFDGSNAPWPSTSGPGGPQYGDVFSFDASSGNVTANMPLAADNRGQTIVLKVRLTGALKTLTITPGGADTIDGAASLVVSAAAQTAVVLVSDGISDWFPVALYP